MINNTQEYLSVWKPLNNLSKKMYVNSLVDSENGLIINLNQKNKDNEKLEIKFNSFLSYRNTNESYLLEKWHSYDRNKLSQSCLFIIKKSVYISWLKKSALSINDELNVIHYAIFTYEDCIEVLSTETPIVSVITLPQDPHAGASVPQDHL